MANSVEKEQKRHFGFYIGWIVTTVVVFSIMTYFWRLFPFTDTITWRPWNVNLYQGREKPENMVANYWTGLDPSVSKDEMAKRVGCSAKELFEGVARPECILKTNLNADNGETMWNSVGASLRQKNVGPFKVKSWAAIFANVGSSMASDAIKNI